MKKLASYHFECQGGPLEGCVDYQRFCARAVYLESLLSEAAPLLRLEFNANGPQRLLADRIASALKDSPEEPTREPPSIDDLIALGDNFILPTAVKIGAGVFAKGVKVGTMLRCLKGHAQQATAQPYDGPNLRAAFDAARDAASAAATCRFNERDGTCDWIVCENPNPGSPMSCPLPWPRAPEKATGPTCETCGKPAKNIAGGWAFLCGC